jgi:hypothetical protein
VCGRREKNLGGRIISFVREGVFGENAGGGGRGVRECSMGRSGRLVTGSGAKRVVVV